MPTVWKRFGVPRAINLGDALIVLASILVGRSPVPPDRLLQALGRLSLEDGRVQRDVLADRREVGVDVGALELVQQRAVVERIAHEVRRPGLIRSERLHQRLGCRRSVALLEPTSDI